VTVFVLLKDCFHCADCCVYCYCCQLADVERVIFCLFLRVDIECYSVWMPKYFPLPANTSDKGACTSYFLTLSLRLYCRAVAADRLVNGVGVSCAALIVCVNFVKC